jgi:hypothetical protein
VTDLPAYIIAEEWDDKEHRELASRLSQPFTREELHRIVLGPRRHPFGPDAYQVMKNGQTWIYPNREVAGE